MEGFHLSFCESSQSSLKGRVRDLSWGVPFFFKNFCSGGAERPDFTMETKSLFNLHRALAQPVKMCMFDFPVSILDDLVSSNTSWSSSFSHSLSLSSAFQHTLRLSLFAT